MLDEKEKKSFSEPMTHCVVSQGLSMQLRLTLNSGPSCLSFPKCCDFRCGQPGLAVVSIFKKKSFLGALEDGLLQIVLTVKI